MLLQFILKSLILVPRKVRHVVKEHTSSRGIIFIQLVIAVEFTKKEKTSKKVVTGCHIPMDLKVA